MTIQELEKLLEELAPKNNLDKSEMISNIADYAKLKFENNFSDIERNLIDSLKIKLLKGFYKMSDHSYVSSRPNYKEKFDLDNLELKVLEQAGFELEKEGLVEGNENYTKLTDEGVLQAKILRGEL